MLLQEGLVLNLSTETNYKSYPISGLDRPLSSIYLMCYIFAYLYFLSISYQCVLILVTTEYSDQCLRRLRCTLQSAAVGGQVALVADPPPAVVAVPEAVPAGRGSQASLAAVRLRWGCLCGR